MFLTRVCRKLGVFDEALSEKCKLMKCPLLQIFASVQKILPLFLPQRSMVVF
jgi:hypothetical protein